MFLDNKYTKTYYNIISISQSRTPLAGAYTEKHHIIPRSLGGSDSANNLTILTAREHLICHKLLVKMTADTCRTKMIHALWAMANLGKNRTRLSSREFQLVKEARSKKMRGRIVSAETRQLISMAALGRARSKETKMKISLAHTGVKRKPLSEETKKKISDGNKGNRNRLGKKNSTDHNEILRLARVGVKHTEETKAKISAKRLGVKNTPEQNLKISLARIGRKMGPLSEETRKKLSESLSGRILPKVICPHCGKSGGGGAMKQWHFDKCKTRGIST